MQVALDSLPLCVGHRHESGAGILDLVELVAELGAQPGDLDRQTRCGDDFGEERCSLGLNPRATDGGNERPAASYRDTGDEVAGVVIGAVVNGEFGIAGDVAQQGLDLFWRGTAGAQVVDEPVDPTKGVGALPIEAPVDERLSQPADGLKHRRCSQRGAGRGPR